MKKKKLRDKIASLDRQLDEAVTANRSLALQRDLAEQSIKRWQQYADEKKKRIEILQEQGRLPGNVAEMQKLLEETTLGSRRMQSQINVLTAENTLMRSQLGELERAPTQATKAEEESQAQINELTAENTTLKSHIQALESKTDHPRKGLGGEFQNRG